MKIKIFYRIIDAIKISAMALVLSIFFIPHHSHLPEILIFILGITAHVMDLLSRNGFIFISDNSGSIPLQFKKKGFSYIWTGGDISYEYTWLWFGLWTYKNHDRNGKNHQRPPSTSS